MNKKVNLLIYIILFLLQVQVYAQVTTASISGAVSDDKSTLPGATVVALHLPSGTKYGTVSLENGRFHLPNLRVGGPYMITITFLGYESFIINDIYLSLGQEMDLNAQMKVSGINIQEVVVSGKQNPVFNADHTGAVTNVSNQKIQLLPSINRSISDMVRITPQSTGNNTFAGRNNLYNNLTINGSLFNNAFGLSSTPGGQTNSQPISLDAIDQIQVSMAPYDVRQSNFTGAGINVITRSGTNEVTGSIYTYWRNQQYLGTKIEGTQVTRGNFNQNQSGFRLGGPIIKNKVFFFINAEMERRTEPAHPFVAAKPGRSGSNVATIQASTLDSLRQFLISKFNYDPGVYENFNLRTYNDKLLFRLDYNISQNHKLNISYNYLKSWKDIVPSSSNSVGSSRFASQNTLWFSNSEYRINNNISSVVGELNSVFGKSISNSLIVGYTGFRDFRSSQSSPFPMVDILRNGTTMTSFGYEQYTPNNKLNTDVIQVSDNVTINKGAHAFTLGGAYEHYHFENGFTPQYYGYFRYNSLSDFYADARDGLPVSLANYQLSYSALAGVSVPLAKISVAQIGFYAQDEWKMLPTLKVTIGVRADLPSYPASLQRNTVVEGLTFLNTDESPAKIDVSKLPGIKLLWSPRIGFNWDVFGNKTTQVRGGVGVFTGRIPFVWLSNQASNNGVLFGNINSSPANGYPFSSDVTKYIPANPTVPATVLINATSNNFKFPQVLRNSLAIDQKLPFGVIGTLEGIYTKDINAVIHRDYNLIAPTGTLPDGRDTFSIITNGRRVNKNITNAYVLENTSKGYSYFLTAQLQKAFNFGLDVMAAFTYGQTKDLSANPGSIASSAFTGNPVQSNPNKPELSWSTYDQPYKLVAVVSYRKEYFDHFASSLSLIYNGVQGGGGSSNERLSDGRFSYTYSGDLNKDGISGNDLIYIPKNQSEINLIPVPKSTDTRTPDEIWNQLNAYIEQDAYLKKHRGQIMERNGAITPWNSQIDLKFTQDIFMNFGHKRNTLEFSIDIINFSNLLNSNWGVKKTVNRRQLLTFQDYKGPNGTPRFSFPYFDPTNKIPLTSTFSDDLSLASRWQVQFGLRYIF